MELVGTFLYVLQQFGVMLGVGAATFALLFYVLSERDGVVDASEERFIRAVYAVLWIALFLIISSGFVITLAHLLVNETAIALAPAYLFKWALLGVIILCGISMRARLLPPVVGMPLMGGSWFALFAVHILAPESTWGELLALYALWVVLLFGGLALIRGKRGKEMEVAPHAPMPLPSPVQMNVVPKPPVSPFVPTAKETPVIHFPLK